MSSTRSHYRGRFAPTPSGPLHLGSLLTALASYLETRRKGGDWLLRIDDLDAPRCRPEHADTIMRQLEAHGLRWDQAPRRQSRHIEEYVSAFERLRQSRHLYRCRCTRAELAQSSRSGPDGDLYAGTCRHRVVGDDAAGAWRLRVEAGAPVLIVDRWLGRLARDRQAEIGDFVVRRIDGQIGYQLACVVDDLATGVTDVVRGGDLVGSSLRQVLLFEALGKPPPRYGHLPVLIADDGRKLSKQNHARPIDPQHALDNLQHCLRLLGQSPVAADAVDDLLDAAARSWDPSQVPAATSLPVADAPA